MSGFDVRARVAEKGMVEKMKAKPPQVRTWEGKFKAIEDDWNDKIDPGHYAIVRVDGRAFSHLSKLLDKPYSIPFMDWMDAAAVALCHEMQGAVFAYVQSDEISVLMVDGKHSKQGRWFDWNVNKLVSISASVATAAFNIGFQHDKNEMLWTNKKPGVFDARVIPLEHRIDVMQYFLWRQHDAKINAISMIADRLCGSAALQGVNMNGRIDLLMEKGWSVQDIPAQMRLGRVVTPERRPGTVEYTHKITGEKHTTEVMRNHWTARLAPWFDWDEAGFLEANVPEKVIITTDA